MTFDLRDDASLLASRICHDLISPLGAISNGLELLAMSGIGETPEMKLIEESVANANARVRFFRVALGASSGSHLMARGDILNLVKDTYDGGRIAARWDVSTDPSRTDVKLAFLAMMCCEIGLPQGGEVIVTDDRGSWTVQAYGPKIRVEPELWARLKTPADTPVEAAKIQFPLLCEALRATDRVVEVGHSDSAISLRY